MKRILVLVCLFTFMAAGAVYAEKVMCCKTVCKKGPFGQETCTTECKETYFCN